MFHLLNTEEIRDPVFGLPNWHIGFETSDRLGRRIYLDGERNLLVMAVSPPTTRFYYVATPEKTRFYPDAADEFTVPVTTDALLIYSQGELISETVLPARFADQFFSYWLSEHEPRYDDFGAALKARGLDIDVPLPPSSRVQEPVK